MVVWYGGAPPRGSVNNVRNVSCKKGANLLASWVDSMHHEAMQGFSCLIHRFLISFVKYVSDFKDPQSVQSHTILGVSAACRKSFSVFTFRTFFITQPAGPATYSQGKGRYSWIIFRKISPYNLLRRPVWLPAFHLSNVHGHWSMVHEVAKLTSKTFLAYPPITNELHLILHSLCQTTWSDERRSREIFVFKSLLTRQH